MNFLFRIVPTVLLEMLHDPDPLRADRVMRVMLQMVKIDIAGLQRAYDNGWARGRYLASPEAAFVTGASLSIDGGFSA